MRNLRHPITGFVVAVLAIIGTGVAVVAATTNQKVYGPSWGRFTAAFPGRVDGFQRPRPLTVSVGDAPLKVTNAAVFDYYVTPPIPSTGYAPLSIPSEYFLVGGEDVYSTVGAAPAIHAAVRFDKRAFFHAGVHQSLEDGNGVSVITIGPQCTKGECRAAQIVTNGQVFWVLLAFSKGPVSNVQSFLASFQPIG